MTKKSKKIVIMTAYPLLCKYFVSALTSGFKTYAKIKAIIKGKRIRNMYLIIFVILGHTKINIYIERENKINIINVLITFVITSPLLLYDEIIIFNQNIQSKIKRH